jgi:hypothetical protein
MGDLGAFLLALVFLCGMDSDAAVAFTRSLLNDGDPETGDMKDDDTTPCVAAPAA